MNPFLSMLTRPMFTDAALLIFRVTLGGWMAYFGHEKIFGDLAGFVGYVTDKLGMPAFFGYAAAYTELVGGILVVLGLLTRPAAFLMLLTMLVAAFVAHAADPFSKKEHALVYASSTLLLMAIGAGKYSIDALLANRQKQ